MHNTRSQIEPIGELWLRQTLSKPEQLTLSLTEARYMVEQSGAGAMSTNWLILVSIKAS